MINAGKYNQQISIYSVTITEDSEGFKTTTKTLVLSPYAHIKTTSGFTLITAQTDFEEAHTNFTIRYPKTTITRDMIITYKGKDYQIDYLNDVDEQGIELEMQAKEITK